MALSLFYASEDDAPEALREHLIPVENGDGYTVDLVEDDFRNHPQAQGAMNALRTERKARKEAEKRLASGDFSDDDRLELENLRARVPELEAEAKTATGKLRVATIDSVIARAVADHRGDPKTLPRAIRSDIAADDEGVYVKGPDGEPVISKEGDRMTVADYVANMSKDADYSAFFLSTQRSGAGTPPGNRSTPPGDGQQPRDGRPGMTRLPTALEKRNAARRDKIDAFRERQQQQ